MKKMKFIIFSSIFLFSIISKSSSYTSSYNSSFEKRLSTYAKNPLEKRNQTKYPQSTKLTSTGKGSILNLSLHKIECPDGKALNAIHMWGKWNAFSDNQFAYQFNCLESKSLTGQEINKKSAEAQVGKDPADSLNILSSLVIACDKNSVLKKIQMNKSDDNKKVFYNYTCVKANTKQCQQKATKQFNIKENYVGKKVINQLSQFHIDADQNTFLQSIKYVKGNNKSSAKYEYTFCSLAENASNENQSKTLILKK